MTAPVEVFISDWQRAVVGFLWPDGVKGAEFIED
jgi:hypothetical protein